MSWPISKSAAIDEIVGLEIAAPRTGKVERLLKTGVLPPFSPEARAFINGLSRAILKDKGLRIYPELMAFAHWMRKRNILDLQQQFEAEAGERFFFGRGVALHIAPANVDTIFLYCIPKNHSN